MDLNTYKGLWEQLKPAMLEKMTALVGALQGAVPYTVSEPYLSGPDEQFGSDEYRVSVVLKNEQGITVLGIDFKFQDGAEEGAEGCAVFCSLTGYNALVLGAYSPAAYSDDFYTLDGDELMSRVDDFDVAAAALFVQNDALKDETLLKEVAEAIE